LDFLNHASTRGPYTRKWYAAQRAAETQPAMTKTVQPSKHMPLFRQTALVFGAVKHTPVAYFRCVLLDQRMQAPRRRANFLSA
jgi:hypothetical protein